MIRSPRLSFATFSLCSGLIVVACSSPDSSTGEITNGDGGRTAGGKAGTAGRGGASAGSAGAKAGGQAGTGAASGTSGSSGKGGAAGNVTGGKGGAAGQSGASAASGGASGAGAKGGASGMGGSSGGSGASGKAGTSGSGGASGGAGAASGGAGGSGGADVGGSGGAGLGGTSGSGGASGAATVGGSAGASGSTTCAPVVAAPDVDPWAMRLPSAGFGGLVEKKSGGHTDVFLQSPATPTTPENYIRVGARLDWGGSLVFYGLGANAQSNVLDANDTGREVQVALYDPSRIRQPCAGTATCESAPPPSCGNSITYLGWDPVQGGDECGHGGQVLSHGRAGDALQMIIQPLQWNPDWDKPTCASSACGPQGVPAQVTYRFELRFVRTNVVELMTEVNSTEAFSHPPTGQEFPTMYVANGKNGPDLPILLDSAGVSPAINQPANDGFFHGEFASPEPWVTWQNANKDYGVALGHDQGLRNWQGWRGEAATSAYFHNVRAQIAFGIPANGTVRGLSYLALGSFDTVKGELAATFAKRAPFGHIDLPEAGADTTYVPGGTITFSGWVLDNEALSNVRFEVDGAEVGAATVGADRSDVCSVYPAYPGCPKPGFNAGLDTKALSPCAHLVRVLATDANGNSSVLGERVIRPASGG